MSCSGSSLTSLRLVSVAYSQALTNMVSSFACKPVRIDAVEKVCSANVALWRVGPRGLRMYGWDPVDENAFVAMSYSDYRGTCSPFPGSPVGAGASDAAKNVKGATQTSGKYICPLLCTLIIIILSMLCLADSSESSSDSDAEDADVFRVVDLLSSKLLALEHATEAAIAVLRMENVIVRTE